MTPKGRSSTATPSQNISADPTPQPTAQPRLNTFITIDRDASLHVLSRHDLGFVHDDLAMTRMHPQSYTNTFVSDRMTYLFEWLYYLQRYGAQALEPSEFAQVCGPFRRYYLRQLMKWSGRLDRTAFVSQMEGLDGLGVRPRPWDYMDALLDWFIVRTGQRRVWPGFNLEWK